MTNSQKAQIRESRGKGESYARIAAALDISENTIKSYCKRNNLGGRLTGATQLNIITDGVCKQCGEPLAQKRGQKPRKFCSASCRSAWWSAHPDQIRQRAVYSFVCPSCGNGFTTYGNKSRRYCSHECYIKARFWGGRA
jgi:endogenous inhibitor of DNA gyrase (YacG/DUF329 family)